MVNTFSEHGLEKYPHKFETTLQLEFLFKKYQSLNIDCGVTEIEESSCGRI